MEGARVAIVGAGVGGLALALALQTHHPGVSVTVFERSEKPRTRGGQIGIWREGLDVLKQLGIGDEVSKALVDVRRFTSWHNGLEKCRIDLPAGTRVRLMREALHQVLLDRLQPGTLRLGCEIKGVVPIHAPSGRKAGVILSSGLTETFELVVGADGANSNIAKHVFGAWREGGPDFVGIVSLVCIARAGNQTRRQYDAGVFHKHFVDSEETGRFRVLSATGGTLEDLWDYVSVSISVPKETPVPSDWEGEGTKEEILRYLKNVPGGAAREQKIVEEAERVFRWGIYDNKPKPTWVSTEPPVVLIGDAAHAMAPYLGRGANEALLDAWSLATELGRPGQSLLGAMQAFEHERKTLAEGYQVKSRAQMNKFFNMKQSFGNPEVHVPRTGMVAHGLKAQLMNEDQGLTVGSGRRAQC